MACCSSNAESWNYYNQDKWEIYYIECGNHRQSPIDINSRFTVSSNAAQLLTTNGDKPNNADVIVDGDSVIIKVSDAVFPLTLTYGTEEYDFDSIHFHWADNCNPSSEHSVNGQYFDMEYHAVWYNKKYGSFDAALGFDDGLAVIAEPVVIDDTLLTSFLTPVAQSLPLAASTGSAPLPGFQLCNYVEPGQPGPLKGNVYYSYSGSLTTPNCGPVNWIVDGVPKRISRGDYNSFA
ncbi:carbonic anhydrase 6-like, partial [Musca vetustissima]|uniref:carbonic anhydrase 6-like n=1 Tax=Musca vetustissima TaxID=27455 RepID=UPI002AB772ED